MTLIKRDNGYVPLYPNIRGLWEKSFAELPPELAALVSDAFPLYFPWDDFEPADRESFCWKHDVQDDPSFERPLRFDVEMLVQQFKAEETKARDENKDSRALAFNDVVKALQGVLDFDPTERARSIAAEQAAKADAESTTYPPELAAALTVWREAAQTPDAAAPKALIDALLEREYPGVFQKEAKDRIAKMCNWKREGGRPAKTKQR